MEGPSAIEQLSYELLHALPLSLQDLGRAASASRHLKRAYDQQPTAWARLLAQRWGVRVPPSEARKTLKWLETTVRHECKSSFGRGLALIPTRLGLLLDEPPPASVGSTAPSAGSEEWAEPAAPPRWLLSARHMLGWLPLDERRRLASYICTHSDHLTLGLFLRLFSTALEGTSTPEVGLRRLLLEFPFLPIDAGTGADRVIGQFAVVWLLANADAWRALGIPSSASLETARDVVYTFTYAVVMLNTDLNNPAVHPKIRHDEFVANCRRCTTLASVPLDVLADTYERIAHQPLAIYTRSSAEPSTNPALVDSFVRSTLEGEVSAPPLYSTYSSLGAQRAIEGQPRRPEVDWMVAFYNIRDFERSLEFSASRRFSACAQEGALRLPGHLAAAMVLKAAAVASRLLSLLAFLCARV